MTEKKKQDLFTCIEGVSAAVDALCDVARGRKNLFVFWF